MQVPLLDLTAQYQSIKPKIDKAVIDVLNSQKGILGPEVQRLEAEMARYLGAKHAVAVASGTDALLLSLMAIDTAPGDGIITTPFTFFATAGCIHRLGARTFFVDIDETYNLSPTALEIFLSQECEQKSGHTFHRGTGCRIRALIPVHLYGQCADMTALSATCKKWGLKIIEDACQAILASHDGKQAGRMGDFGCFSFFPSKNLGGLGDGGLITTPDDDAAKLLRILRVHGSEPKYYHRLVGINSRLDTLQAAIILVKLDHLKEWTESRQRNASFYTKQFQGNPHIAVPVCNPMNNHVFNQYCIRVKERDRLRDHLTKHAVGSEIYYPVPLHLQECFRYLEYKKGDFPASERASSEVLALPVYPELTEVQRKFVAETILSFYNA
ncbi:MAG TPA: DegT/DnrJ/EryC1/StrS family aminotransferase [Elusimicrobiota bacterium]|nr:DegT/DnrJ/EryC1/StrS family aminotransferase [Elusimicrobiota bacterium]